MSHAIIRYHEVALKGANRSRFIARLAGNVAAATADLPIGRVRRLCGRLLLPLRDTGNWRAVRERLRTVFGIANFSRGGSVSHDLEVLTGAIWESVRSQSFGSFRIETKRAHKGFPLNSLDINRRLGAAVQALSGAAVDLEGAELTIRIEVLRDRILYSTEHVTGPGGLPVGTSGSVLALLSGGIDSPVAAYRMMQRGCRVGFVHFHSVPYLNRTSQEKATEHVEHLTRHQFSSRLFLVPFGEVQRAVVLGVAGPYRVVLYRRLMLRIAETLARRTGAAALVTGESVGQVASQTLENLTVIEAATNLPVLRPLVGMDKAEITAQAERIGTFQTSIIPDQDCCQLFVPRHPVTRARPEDVAAYESRLDMPALVAMALAGTRELTFRFPPRREEAAALAGRGVLETLPRQ